ncbi:MAG: transposase, partial [Ruminiclostridium sp.]
AIERLSRYIVRAPLSQERMNYISEKETVDGTARVVYEGKTTGKQGTFTATDWLARLVTHIPNRGEQLVRYYGYYSNKSRGQRKKTGENTGECLHHQTSAVTRKKLNKAWARLIQKIYNVNPLKCPHCNGTMKIIAFIEDEATIKKILKHLKLWKYEHGPPTKDSAVTETEISESILHPAAMKKTAVRAGSESQISYHRSYEQWEKPHTSLTHEKLTAENMPDANSYDNSPEIDSDCQSPYEDEYSQLTPYEY